MRGVFIIEYVLEKFLKTPLHAGEELYGAVWSYLYARPGLVTACGVYPTLTVLSVVPENPVGRRASIYRQITGHPPYNR